MSLKERITEDMKSAMRAAQKERLGTVRMILAGIKQREVDERVMLDDSQVLAVIDKMVKQRKESIAQFETGGRADLVAKEKAEIALLQEKGATVVIVSASPENWIGAWTTHIQASLLATRLELTPTPIPRHTGRILGRNCHSEEKVRRIREAYPLSDYNEIYAYGDTKGDKPMLRLGTASFYKPFR